MGFTKIQCRGAVDLEKLVEVNVDAVLPNQFPVRRSLDVLGRILGD
jgi:hypothetical protein